MCNLCIHGTYSVYPLIKTAWAVDAFLYPVKTVFGINLNGPANKIFMVF